MNYFKSYPTVKILHVVNIIESIDDSIIDTYRFEDIKRAVKLYAHLIANDINADITEEAVYVDGKFIFE